MRHKYSAILFGPRWGDLGFMLEWVGTYIVATYIWLAIIIGLIVGKGNDMPEGSSIGFLFAAMLLGLLTVLLTGCEPYQYEIPQAGPPPVFDWQASAAVDNVRAPKVRVVE